MKAVVEGQVMGIIPQLTFGGKAIEDGEIALYQEGERTLCNVRFPTGHLPKSVVIGQKVKLPVRIGSYVSKQGQSAVTCKVDM